MGRKRGREVMKPVVKLAICVGASMGVGTICQKSVVLRNTVLMALSHEEEMREVAYTVGIASLEREVKGE